MNTTPYFWGLGLYLAGLCPCIAQTAAFYPLGDDLGGDFESYAVAISQDGTTVAVRSHGFNGTSSLVDGVGDTHGYATLEGGHLSGIALGPLWGNAGGLSGVARVDDEVILVGHYHGDPFGPMAGQSIAAYFIASTREIVDIPMPQGQGLSSSEANDISEDGNIIVGETGGQAFHFNRNTSTLKTAPTTSFSEAIGVSDDGNLVAGTLETNGFPMLDGFRWDLSDNRLDILSFFSMPQASTPLFSSSTDISNDGTVVGFSVGQVSPETFATIWDPDAPISHPLHYTDKAWSTALAIASIENTVIGMYDGNNGSPTKGLIIPSSTGMAEDAEEYFLENHGLTLPAGWSINSLNDITPDGQCICGSGTNANGDPEAFLIKLFPGGYLPWINGYGITTAMQEPDANPANDGINNLLKFAFNLNPTIIDIITLTPGTGVSGLPFASVSGGQIQIEYIRRRNEARLDYEVQFSDHLGEDWEAEGTETSVVPIDADWERVIHTDAVASPTPARRFFRIHVSLTP